ncbi:MAG TPA: carbohydrate kinase family protein [Candidatus Woesebacteria bacterium]|nr:carbohydrate kinase family protein [Candidatus Woesebacteria bacterium]
MYDVISIGSSLLDIFIQSNDLEANRIDNKQTLTYGDKLELSDFHIVTGGGASNTAVAFARLGLNVAVISETGCDEFASLITADFQKEGVETNLLIQEKLERTGGSVVLVAKNSERVALVHRGAASLLDPFDIPAFWLSQSRWIHLSSIGGRQETLSKIFKVLNNNQETKMSWNPGKKELLSLVAGAFSIEQIPCEVFFVNQEEWQLVEPLHEQILLNFPQVVITKGKEGGEVHYFGKKKFEFVGEANALVDSTGAGDAFAAGYVAALLNGYQIPMAIAWGVKNAGNVIAYFGAKLGLLRKAQILELTKQQN